MSQQDPNDEIQKLRDQVLSLSGTVSQINSLVLSDWATCSVGGADALTALQQNICKIAQAATLEAKVQLKGELSSFVAAQDAALRALSDRLDNAASNVDIVQLKTDVYGNATGATCSAPIAGSVCARLNSAQSSITTLQSTVASQGTSISGLTASVATLNAQLAQVINGAMIELTIGSENLAAGPLFESVLRNPLRNRLVAYVEAVGPNIAIANNGCSTLNGSPTVTMTTGTVHALVVGNVIKLSGMSSCSGLSSAVMNDQYVVTSVPSTTTFTFTAPLNASSGGNGGGNAGFMQQINGRSLAQFWTTISGTTKASTTFSNRPYTFQITGTSTVFTAAPTAGALPNGWAGLTSGPGFVCYDVTNRSATQSTVLAGGSNIICK